MNEEVASGGSDTVTNEQISEAVNNGFAESGERFDQISNLILDSNVNRVNEYNTLLEVMGEKSEDRFANEEEAQQTTEELLTDINNQLILQSDLIAGQNFMFGIICGILLFRILWDRLRA